MNSHASYIFSAYFTVLSRSKDNILQIGNLSADGIPIPSFDEDVLVNLCAEAEKIFESEENILNINGDVIIVGDIHGSLHDLIQILHYIESDHLKVLFLGDYVDRGNFSLECITILFSLKVLYPDSFYLIRGNHEFDCMCSQYGFKKEILNYHNPIYDESYLSSGNDVKYNEGSNDNSNQGYFANHININCYKYTERLYEAFLEAFSFLPISAIINNTTICIHGGLSPKLRKINDIQKNIQRPITDFKENELFGDLLWGDPYNDLSHLFNDNPRGFGKVFNGVTVSNFLKGNNLKRLVRGHECVNSGINELFNGKCITVFSASSYSPGLNNKCGILKIHQIKDKVEPISFNPIPRLQKCDASYYKVQSFIETEVTKLMLSFFNKISPSLSTPSEAVEALDYDCETNVPLTIHKSSILFTENKRLPVRRASLAPQNPFKMRKEKQSGSLKNITMINHSFNTGINHKIAASATNAFKYNKPPSNVLPIPKPPNVQAMNNFSPLTSDTTDDNADIDRFGDIIDEKQNQYQEFLPALF